MEKNSSCFVERSSSHPSTPRTEARPRGHVLIQEETNPIPSKGSLEKEKWKKREGVGEWEGDSRGREGAGDQDEERGRMCRHAVRGVSSRHARDVTWRWPCWTCWWQSGVWRSCIIQRLQPCWTDRGTSWLRNARLCLCDTPCSPWSNEDVYGDSQEIDGKERGRERGERERGEKGKDRGVEGEKNEGERERGVREKGEGEGSEGEPGHTEWLSQL